MRSVKLILCFFAALLVCARAQQESPPSRRVVIAASAVLDGKGRMLHNTRIVIEGSRIMAIDPKAGPVDYDLRGMTVLPGWIDAHVHMTWTFGSDGKCGHEPNDAGSRVPNGFKCVDDVDGRLHNRAEPGLAG